MDLESKMPHDKQMFLIQMFFWLKQTTMQKFITEPGLHLKVKTVPNAKILLSPPSFV